MSETIVGMERALLAVIQPLSGSRATGQALVHALGAPFLIPKNTYGIPLVQSATGDSEIDFTRIVKTSADTTVDSSGTLVPLLSVTGGTRMNLVGTTQIRWDPPIPEIEDLSAITAPGLTGGTAPDPLDPEGLQQVVTFEGLGAANTAKSFWSAGLGEYPAVVVGWESLEPGKMYGVGKNYSPHKFNIFVVTKRLDGDPQRRNEGKRIFMALHELLSFRAEVDGEVFSVPPTMTGAGGRLTLSSESYVYYFSVVVHHTTRRRESRTYTDWKTSRERMRTTPADLTRPPGEEQIEEVDPTQDMP